MIVRYDAVENCMFPGVCTEKGGLIYPVALNRIPFLDKYLMQTHVRTMIMSISKLVIYHSDLIKPISAHLENSAILCPKQKIFSCLAQIYIIVVLIARTLKICNICFYIKN